VLDHISIGVTDLKRSAAFYDAVLESLGLRQVFRDGDLAIGYGISEPWFWIDIPLDVNRPVTAGNGTHIAFKAQNREAVHSFHALALKHGGHDASKPGLRPHYGPDYYGAFAFDPDGHKIEAVFRFKTE
jgi:catechol 2,3-dioxygenase-like lactoylglutathione lyase family enzyme